MSATICLTNDLEGVRSCTIRGEHLTGCAHTDDDQCRGCLPYPAESGMLCRNCFEKFSDALKAAPDLIPHLRSIEKGPTSLDGVRSSTISQPTYPASWMQADELWIELAHVAIEYSIDTRTTEPNWPAGTSVIHGFLPETNLDTVTDAVKGLVRWVTADADLYVKYADTAEAAIRFYVMTQSALHRYPRDEDIKAVPHLRCRKCKQFSVDDVPPLAALEPRVLKCHNPSCGHEVDVALMNWDLRVWADLVWTGMDDDARAEAATRFGPDERRIVREFVTETMNTYTIAGGGLQPRRVRGVGTLFYNLRVGSDWIRRDPKTGNDIPIVNGRTYAGDPR